MGYQFLHVESYARNAGKGKAGGHTIRSVADEADRIGNAFPHVEHAKPPKIRFGISAHEAANLAEKWAETATDARDHKLRKDGLCMVGGVISYPSDGKNWEKFLSNSIHWLKKKYGDRLKSVIEHTDEPFRHVHFYVVPDAGERFESIHEGRAASQDAKAKGLLKGAQNLAYKAAMRGLQDEFCTSVGMLNGLTRLGPRRRRLSRVGWRHEQRTAEYFADLERHYKSAKKKGYADGKEKLKKEREEFAEKVAESIAEVAKKILGPLHRPTARAKTEARSFEAQALEEKAKRKKIEQKFKTESNQIRAAAQIEIDRSNRVARTFEAENAEKQRKIDELNAELRYYKRHGNPPQNSLNL